MAEFDGVRRVKLTPPMPPSDAVRRVALIERLDRAAALPLITVTAPAGFGKTTLLAAWARSRRRRVAWLSLDDADGDLLRFAAYLAAAIRSVEPGAVPSLEALLGGRRDLTPESVAAVLADDLLGLTADLTLVVEDLHAAHDPAPAAVLDALLRYPPPRFHLVITSRQETGGANQRRLWSRGLALALTDDDLRFGRGEIASVLGKTGEERIAEVETRTDGWPAGVRALSLVGPAERSAHAGRIIRSYLIEDALAGQPSQRARLLRATAVAERLTPDLAAALAGGGMTPDAARQALDDLVEDRFFCTRIDAEWVRVHPLLRDALLAEAGEAGGPDAVDRQHRAASEWFAARGMADEAVDHALKAGSLADAADLIASHAPAWFAQDRILSSSGFIERLPADLVRERPALLLLQAHARVLRGRLAEVGPLIDAAAALLEARPAGADPRSRAHDPALRIEIASLRCVAAYHLGDPRPVLDLAESLLSVEFARFPYVVLQAVVAYAQAMTMVGRGDEATSRLADWVSSATLAPDPRAAMAAAGCFHIASAAGDLDASLHWAEAAVRHAPPAARRIYLAATVMRFGVLLELGAAARCEEALAQADAADRSSNLLVVSAFHVLKAQYLVDRRRFGEARAVVAEARRMADLADLGPVIEVCDALEASVALAAGDVAAAGRWADRARPAWRPSMAHQTEPPPIVLARILAARQAPGDLDRAEDLLREAIRHGEISRQALPGLRALPVLAVVLAARGDAPGAREAMRRALTWKGIPLVRSFTVLGDPARLLLESIAADPADAAAAPARRVLAAWTLPAPAPASAAALDRVRADLPAADAVGAVARLSNRELDVLRLIARRHSNKEIAAALGISPDTVKEYSSAIYRKLGVSDRHAAADVLRAAPEFT